MKTECVGYALLDTRLNSFHLDVLKKDVASLKAALKNTYADTSCFKIVKVTVLEEVNEEDDLG